MNIRSLFNSTLEDHLPKKSARVHRIAGIGTKTLQAGRDWFMSETSPLHFRFRRDHEAHAFVQAKYTVDDDSWGEPVYPWTNAPRPHGRPVVERMSGLRVDDLKLAANHPIGEARQQELTQSLLKIKPRIGEEEWEELQMIYDDS